MGFLNEALVDDQLHTLDTAAEVGVEESGNSGEGNVVSLFRSAFLCICWFSPVPKDTVR